MVILSPASDLTHGHISKTSVDEKVNSGFVHVSALILTAFFITPPLLRHSESTVQKEYLIETKNLFEKYCSKFEYESRPEAQSEILDSKSYISWENYDRNHGGG